MEETDNSRQDSCRPSCPVARACGGIGLALLAAAVAFSLAASFAVAVLGFGWGLPAETHIQSYHPDEQNITYSLRNMNPAEMDFNPRFFGNPTFYTYQVGALALATSYAGLLPREMSEEYWLAHPESVRRFYIVGRGLSLLYAMGSLVLVYVVAHRLTGDRIASAGAVVIFACLPAVAVHSHYMSVNASAVFWSLAALLFALRLRDKPSWTNYLWAGVLAGLAISTKLSNAFLPFAILAAHLQASPGKPLAARLFSGKLCAAAGICLAAFFAGSPYYLLSFGAMQSDPHNRMNFAAFLSMSDPVGQVLAHFWNHLAASCGQVFAVMFLLAGPAVLLLDRRRSAPIVAVALPFLAVALKSGWWAFPSRMLPLLALAAIFTAGLVRKVRAGGFARFAVTAVMAGAFASAGVWNFAYFNLMRGEHVRAASSRWISQTIEPGSTIAVLETPYFDDPDIVYENALHPGRTAFARYDIENLHGDYDSLSQSRARWLVVPQRFEDKLAQGGREGIIPYAAAHGFELAGTFSRDFDAFGIRLRDWVPADMVQQYPVYVFRRTEGS